MSRTLTISRFLDDDLATGNVRIVGMTFCDGQHVAVVESLQSDDVWHYLSDPYATGEIAHTVDCCRHLTKG